MALFSGYDCIHYHAEGPSVMLFLPHMFGIRTVVTIHGLDWQRGKWKNGFASKYLKLGEKIAAKYADKKEFFISVDNDFPEEASLFKQLYNKNAEKLFNNFIEKGKESRTLYRDTLHLMGMRMTDGTEE